MIENIEVKILDYENGQTSRNQRINLFEYCFAIGKLMKQECKYILGTKFGNSLDVDSLGFVLLSTILTNLAKNRFTARLFSRCDVARINEIKVKDLRIYEIG